MKFMRMAKLLSVLLLMISYLRADVCYQTKVGDHPLAWRFVGKFKPGETFYGKNISLLNNANREDQIFYMRHTLDFGLNILYGQTACERTFLEIMFGARNKGVWGNSTSIAQTTDVTIKLLDSVGEAHKHFLPRHILWIREAWLKFDVGEMLRLNFVQGHTFTIGAFSFILGRGISLGDAYAVSPDYLGFSSDSAVDQYAFGMKLSGEIVERILKYDIYSAFLNNQASSLGQTGAYINGQIYGKQLNPIRGFAIINYVFAARLFWTPFSQDGFTFSLEPYFLYDNDPEQTVEVFADASVKLGTFGIAGEYIGPKVEFGFDTSFNTGFQKVKGLDRNVIKQQNRNGRLVFVNSHVLVNANPLDANVPGDLSPYNAPQSKISIATPSDTPPPVPPLVNTIVPYGKQVQNIIYAAPQEQVQNGKLIGSVPGYSAVVQAPTPASGAQLDDIYNAIDRFRDPYVNQFTGWMFVSDAAVYFLDRDLKLAATAGIASGDSDPNFVEIDGVYSGFIGLQGTYSGKRVPSAFILGSAGKLQRPLMIPEEVNEPDDFAAQVSDFTNLVFAGWGVTWEPADACRRWSINPNLLWYWLAHPDKKFDVFTKKTLAENASKYLGVEFNIFYNQEIIKNCKFFLVWSMFAPGQYYHDIRGKPMNAKQQRILDQVDPTGFEGEVIPGIGINKAWTVQAGFEIKF